MTRVSSATILPVSMPAPDRIAIDSLQTPFYEGSVQRLYAVDDAPDLMVSETTGRGSVFDVGSIFEIEGSDLARAIFRHAVYSRFAETGTWTGVRDRLLRDPLLPDRDRDRLLNGILPQLCERGARTHHGGMLDAVTGRIARQGLPKNPSRFNLVRRYRILKPSPCTVLGRPLFDYSAIPGSDGYVIPLEFITRFGVAASSSIYRRYLAMDEPRRHRFLAELDAGEELRPWQLLPKPISDCTTKFEPEDRAVSRQEALTISGLTGPRFAIAMELAVLGSWAVRNLLEPTGLTLWDLKWEFARDGDDLVFVDTIDTDSLRATHSIVRDGQRLLVHFNKQAMRDYYALCHVGWLAGVKRAKTEASRTGVPFTEILAAAQAKDDLPPTPDPDPAFLAVQRDKMRLLQDHLLGKTGPGDTESAFDRLTSAELAFYAERGLDEEFANLNRIS